MKDIKTMSSSDCLDNADSYTVFAKSAKLGCSGENTDNNNGNGNDDDRRRASPSHQPVDKAVLTSDNTPASPAKGPGGVRPSSPSPPLILLRSVREADKAALVTCPLVQPKAPDVDSPLPLTTPLVLPGSLQEEGKTTLTTRVTMRVPAQITTPMIMLLTPRLPP
ncbi:hypothetical protein E4U58_003102 [Claviceps cyperi]|nr:hypothetical protein E4U58_003102 [Claviceps cyperi]